MIKHNNRKYFIFIPIFIVSIYIIFTIPSFSNTEPQEKPSRREVINEVSNITGITKDSLGLVFDESPELFSNLDDAVFAIKVVNLLGEGDNTEALNEIAKKALGTVVDKLMEEVFPQPWNNFVTAVKLYSTALQSIKEYVVIPRFNNRIYKRYKERRLANKGIEQSFNEVVTLTGSGYYPVQAELKEKLRKKGWRQKPHGKTLQQEVDNFWMSRLEARFQQEQFQAGKQNIIKKVRNYYRNRYSRDILAIKKRIQSADANPLTGVETEEHSNTTQDRSEESILHEYRYLYVEYLMTVHKENRVDIKANAVKVGSNLYQCAYDVYCIIKDGPRKGEEYKCASFNKNFSLSQLHGLINDMQRYLKNQK